mgnify:CR=1 FL=1
MILHTLNKAQSFKDLNKQLSQVCTDDDSVLLIEDAVYHLLDPNLCSIKQDWSFKAKRIFALANDAEARGITKKNLGCDSSKLSLISYEEFVELSANHKNTVSWY